MSGLVYLKDVVTLRFHPEKCINCGSCLDVCPRGVLVMSDGAIMIKDRDSCMECGACAKNCPVECLEVKRGVGCAVAVINSALGRKSSSCCCSLDTDDCNAGNGKGQKKNSFGCC